MPGAGAQMIPLDPTEAAAAEPAARDGVPSAAALSAYMNAVASIGVPPLSGSKAAFVEWAVQVFNATRERLQSDSADSTTCSVN